MIGAVLVTVVSGAKGRMECLDKCGVNELNKKEAVRLTVERHNIRRNQLSDPSPLFTFAPRCYAQYLDVEALQQTIA